ncbi:unknown [Bacteroides sp. CAG:1060]|nr:unknown [Bacteroides sp. CAG:1060]
MPYSLFRLILHQVFYDFFLRVEWLQVVQAHGLDGDFHDFFLGDTRRALLLLKEILSCINQCALRHESYDFSSGDSESAGLGCAADFFEGLVKRGGCDIGDVHRDLCYAVFVNVPADSLASLEGARYPDILAVSVFENLAGEGASLACFTALFPDIESHRHGTAGGCGVEVEIDGNKEIACTYVAGSGLG